jgi:hypothetical protein
MKPPILALMHHRSTLFFQLSFLFLGLVLFWPPIAAADDQMNINKASRGAEKFINEYLSATHGSYQAVIAWVNKRPDVFPIFKERLAKLYLDALKEDPECGYGADAILAGIEDLGTKYKSVDTFYGRAHITVTLQATAPAGCKHQVEVVMMEDDDGKWKVQSSGDVSM